MSLRLAWAKTKSKQKDWSYGASGREIGGPGFSSQYHKNKQTKPTCKVFSKGAIYI
jgi:hypothetical protein